MTSSSNVAIKPKTLPLTSLNSEKAHAIIQKIRFSVLQEMADYAAKESETASVETVIKDYIRSKLIFTSGFISVISSLRQLLAAIAQLEVNTTNRATIEKLESFVTYFPHHLLGASLLFEIAQPLYIKFKDNLVDLDNNAEIDALAAHLGAEDKALLIKTMKSWRHTVLESSNVFFELQDTLDAFCEKHKISKDIVTHWQIGIINKFFTKTAEHPDFISALAIEPLQIELKFILEILEHPEVNWLDPASVTKKNDDDMFSNLLSSVTTLSQTIAQFSQLNSRHLLAAGASRSLAQRNSSQKDPVEEVKHQAAKKARKQENIAPKKNLQEVYRNGDRKELRDLLADKRMLNSSDLFKAARQGNRKLVNELLSIRSININDIFVITDNRVGSAKASNPNARSALEIAAEHSHLTVVKLLLGNTKIVLEAEAIDRIMTSDTIGEKVKSAITNYLREKKNKEKSFTWEPVTSPLPSSTSSSPICSFSPHPAASPSPKSATSPSNQSKQSLTDDALTKAMQYFALVENEKSHYNLTLLLSTIAGYIDILKQEYANDIDVVEFISLAETNYHNANERFKMLEQESNKIVNDFKSLKQAALRKTHLQCMKKINQLRDELNSLKEQAHNKLRDFETRATPLEIPRPPLARTASAPIFDPAKAETKTIAANTPSVTVVSSTLFALNKATKPLQYGSKASFEKRLSSLLKDQSFPNRILFEIGEFMQLRALIKPENSKDLEQDVAKYLAAGIKLNQGLFEISYKTKDVDSLARDLLEALTRDDFEKFSKNVFCNHLMRYAREFENIPELEFTLPTFNL